MSPILTIYIPTYNRYLKLKDCMDIICQQIKGHEAEVLVVVSNNNSTDIKIAPIQTVTDIKILKTATVPLTNIV